MRVSHILYSGLGGHGSVFFSLLEASTSGEAVHEPIFFGVEPVRPEYRAMCQKMEIEYKSILKIPGAHFVAQWRVFQALRQMRPQAVVIHSGSSLPAAWLYSLFRRGTVLLFVEHQANELKSRHDWLMSFLAIWLCRKVVYLTEASKEGMARRFGPFFCAERTEMIPNGIDIEKFIPGSSPRVDGELRLGMISRMNDLKDHETLIRCLVYLSGSRPSRTVLLLAGDGPSRQRLEQLAAELGVSDRVQFLGMLDDGQIAEMLQSLDIYVHATLGETMSTAIMQAQSCGLPVVASDVAGVCDQIHQNVDGVLVPLKDPERLAEIIRSLDEDPEQCRRLSRAARVRAEESFSHRRMRAQYDRLILNSYTSIRGR